MNFRRKDRFSDLPDSILCHILSFLPTKDAVKTSLLSTGLKCLSLSHRKIHINHRVHPQMVPFINRLLSSSEVGPVTDFILESESLPQSHVMISWLNALLLRHAKVIHIIDLSAHKLYDIDLPHEFFMSDTLEDLKVCGRRFKVFFPKFANCPNLKALHLKCKCYELYHLGYSSSGLMFRDESYPVLEDLELDFRNSAPVLRIHLSTLKRLKFAVLENYLFKGGNIEIYTPRLQNLDFMDKPVFKGKGWKVIEIREIQFRKCQSLLSAVIGYFHPARVFTSFLYTIEYVKKLHFMECVPLELNYLAADMLHFPNLTHLKLTNTYSVWFFLKRAPALETFVYDGGCVTNFLDSKDDLNLLPKTLREVRLRGLYRDEEDFLRGNEDCLVEVASFFLQHGALLDRLIIEYPPSVALGWPHSALKQLNEVNRLSTECVIELKEE